MKILWWIDHLALGGSQQVLIQTISSLATDNVQQHVICLNDRVDDTRLSVLKKAGVKVYVIGKYNIYSGIGLLKIALILRQYRPNVSVTFLYNSNIIGFILRWLSPASAYICSIRENRHSIGMLTRRLLGSVLRRSDAVVVNSDNLINVITERFQLNREKVFCIRNASQRWERQGVRCRSVVKGKAILQEKLGLNKHQIVIGAIGRLELQKGFDVLIKAMTLVESSGAQLVVYGSGRKEDDLRKLAEKLGLGGRVFWGGRLDNVDWVYESIDLLIIPSRFEGLPNVAVEAMMLGCPIVASGVDGLLELIRDGHDGWLVKPDRPDQLAIAIDVAIQNPEERTRRAASAAFRVREFCDPGESARLWKQILKKTIESSNARADYKSCIRSNSLAVVAKEYVLSNKTMCYLRKRTKGKD